MSEATGPTAKVLFRVLEEDGSAQVETLWAFDLGNSEYRLDNSPLYAYSVSWQDVVYAPFDADEERPAFERVVSKSGNRTVRVILKLPAVSGNSSDRVLQSLVALGCSYEGANSAHISVNIPPEVELEGVRQYLIESQAEWEHADPMHSELFPGGA